MNLMYNNAYLYEYFMLHAARVMSKNYLNKLINKLIKIKIISHLNILYDGRLADIVPKGGKGLRGVNPNILKHLLKNNFRYYPNRNTFQTKYQKGE